MEIPLCEATMVSDASLIFDRAKSLGNLDEMS